jgi:predicted transcriptional regulator
MSASISIRLSDELFQDVKSRAHALHLSQTDYIRKAIELMNDETSKQEREHRLKRASMRVREESMKVNAEFGEIEHDPKT